MGKLVIRMEQQPVSPFAKKVLQQNWFRLQDDATEPEKVMFMHCLASFNHLATAQTHIREDNMEMMKIIAEAHNARLVITGESHADD